MLLELIFKPNVSIQQYSNILCYFQLMENLSGQSKLRVNMSYLSLAPALQSRTVGFQLSCQSIEGT